MSDAREALRLARNLIKVGKVNTVNEKRGMVTVLFEDKDNLVSDEVPMLNFEYNMPAVGDQVLCLFLGNGLEYGFCLGSFYSKKDEPPVEDKNIYRKQFENGAYIEYDKSSGHMKIKADKVTVESDEVYLSDQNYFEHTHDYTWTDSGGSGTTEPPG